MNLYLNRLRGSFLILSFYLMIQGTYAAPVACDDALSSPTLLGAFLSVARLNGEATEYFFSNSGGQFVPSSSRDLLSNLALRDMPRFFFLRDVARVQNISQEVFRQLRSLRHHRLDGTVILKGRAIQGLLRRVDTEDGAHIEVLVELGAQNSRTDPTRWYQVIVPMKNIEGLSFARSVRTSREARRSQQSSLLAGLDDVTGLGTSIDAAIAGDPSLQRAVGSGVLAVHSSVDTQNMPSFNQRGDLPSQPPSNEHFNRVVRKGRLDHQSVGGWYTVLLRGQGDRHYAIVGRLVGFGNNRLRLRHLASEEDPQGTLTLKEQFIDINVGREDSRLPSNLVRIGPGVMVNPEVMKMVNGPAVTYSDGGLDRRALFDIDPWSETAPRAQALLRLEQDLREGRVVVQTPIVFDYLYSRFHEFSNSVNFIRGNQTHFSFSVRPDYYLDPEGHDFNLVAEIHETRARRLRSDRITQSIFESVDDDVRQYHGEDYKSLWYASYRYTGPNLFTDEPGVNTQNRSWVRLFNLFHDFFEAYQREMDSRAAHDQAGDVIRLRRSGGEIFIEFRRPYKGALDSVVSPRSVMEQVPELFHLFTEFTPQFHE